MPDWSWATEVITWEKAKDYIAGGTVASFAKLRRSEQQLTTYRSFMDKVLLTATYPRLFNRFAAVHMHDSHVIMLYRSDKTMPA